METNGVSISRKMRSNCNECGLCLAGKNWTVKRYETTLKRNGRPSIKLQVCGADGGTMARLAKELAFYTALPSNMNDMQTDGMWGRWMEVTIAQASERLAKRLQDFFSTNEQAQLSEAGQTGAIPPWMAEAIQ